MTVEKQLIDKVESIRTTLNEISVYNLDVKTSLELYYELAKKVNEVITELSRFEGVVSDEVIKQNEKLLYLLGEGLKEQVGIKIDELITNGTIQDLINNKIFNDLNTKIETYKQQTDEQFIIIESKKANDNEVVKKGEGTLNDFDEETRALLQGLPSGGTNINAVLGEKNVTTFNLSTDVTELFTDDLDNYTSLENGSIRDTDGQLVNSTIRVRSKLVEFKTGDIISSSNFKFYILKYNSSGSFQSLLQSFTNNYRFTNNEYVRLVIGKNDDSIITTTDVIGNINIVKPSLFNYSNKAIDEIIKNKIDERTLPMITTTINEGNPTIGSISSTDGSNVSSTNRARTNKLLKFSKGDVIKCSSNEKFYGIEYTEVGVFSKVLFNFTNSYTFESECYVRFVFAYNDNQIITDVSTLADLITIQSTNNFNYSNTDIENLINKKELKGKKWVVVGDSTTDSTVHTDLKYHYWVAQDSGITILDYGKSGTGYKRTEESGTAFYQRVATIPTDTDIVTIFGLGNDCSQNYTVGEVTDNTTDTWCGCVNKTIDTILERCPTCNIALVTPYQWGIYPTSSDNKMKELSNKLKEIADYRGFEFLDLYKRSSIRPNNATFNSTYFYNDDKVHLNAEGHKKFLYPKFKQLILGLTNKLS